MQEYCEETGGYETDVGMVHSSVTFTTFWWTLKLFFCSATSFHGSVSGLVIKYSQMHNFLTLSAWLHLYARLRDTPSHDLICNHTTISLLCIPYDINTATVQEDFIEQKVNMTFKAPPPALSLVRTAKLPDFMVHDWGQTVYHNTPFSRFLWKHDW